VSILTHLLEKTADLQRERLLMDVLPERFGELTHDTDTFEEEDRDFPRLANALQRCFRVAFSFVGEDIKRKVMKRYAIILAEASEELIRQYEDAFVRGPDFEFLDADDLALVKAHLLSRLSEEPDHEVLEIADGMARFMVKEDMNQFIDPLVRLAVLPQQTPLKAAASRVLRGAYNVTEEKQDRWITQRLDSWISMFEDKDRETEAETVRGIKSVFELKDPFADE